MTTETRKKDRRRGCYSVAVRRAWQARRRGLNPVIVVMAFIWAFVSAPFGEAVLPAPVTRSRGYEQRSPEDWPVTDYERGHPGPFKHRPSSGGARYRSRPSMQRLMADLRRPAARADAAAALAQRLADPSVRAWAAERIAEDEINRLSIWVRPGRSEEAILAAWQCEAEADLAEKAAVKDYDQNPEPAEMCRVARLLKALAGTETVTSDGPKGRRRI